MFAQYSVTCIHIPVCTYMCIYACIEMYVHLHAKNLPGELKMYMCGYIFNSSEVYFLWEMTNFFSLKG